MNNAVDKYINDAPEFAKPILLHLRKLVHQACPQVQEEIKWGMPSFEYKGLMCGFAAFKKHCVFGFWKAAIMSDKSLMINAKSEVAMGHLGKITSRQDLPSDKKILAYLYEAIDLNERGIKVEKKKVEPLQSIEIPADVLKEIKKNKLAIATYNSFSNSNKKEYISWITDAKTDATKQSRLQQAIEWMAEGKPRNWKYMKEFKL